MSDWASSAWRSSPPRAARSASPSWLPRWLSSAPARIETIPPNNAFRRGFRYAPQRALLNHRGSAGEGGEAATDLVGAEDEGDLPQVRALRRAGEGDPHHV